MSGAGIGIFVATMTGLAEICAEEVAAALDAAGRSAAIHLMDRAGMDELRDVDTIVIVSSTYGHGDIPDNGQAFYESLSALPSLAGKEFAVFALGDRTYSDTFCHAGEAWDRTLAEKGAARIAPLERHDASSGTLAEDVAGVWTAGWADRIALAA